MKKKILAMITLLFMIFLGNTFAIQGFITTSGTVAGNTVNIGTTNFKMIGLNGNTNLSNLSTSGYVNYLKDNATGLNIVVPGVSTNANTFTNQINGFSTTGEITLNSDVHKLYIKVNADNHKLYKLYLTTDYQSNWATPDYTNINSLFNITDNQHYLYFDGFHNLLRGNFYYHNGQKIYWKLEDYGYSNSNVKSISFTIDGEGINYNPELAQFDCSTHTNGNGGDITYSGNTYSYNHIYCFDNNSNLTEVYKTLHNKDNFNSDVAFVLNGDLDFSGDNLNYSGLNIDTNLNLTKYKTGQNTFLPIGGKYDSSAGGENEFNASFYGNNHKITVGNINYPSNIYVGLFGSIGGLGKVYNLKLKVNNIVGGNGAGSLVGHNNGTISKSSIVVNSIIGNGDYIGGVVGNNDNGTISKSSIVVNSITGNGNYRRIGGFVGYNSNGTIENSSVSVNSITGSDSYIGGFAGGNRGGTIENSSTIVNSVNGENGSNVGGFIGNNSNNGIISGNSVVINLINGNGNYTDVGGFIGYFENGTITNSSVVVNNVSGNCNEDNKGIGGFVGQAQGGTITNSSVVIKNSVNGTYKVGGFAGYNTSIITNVSVSGNNIIGNSSAVGGLVGYNNGGAISGSSVKINSVVGDNNSSAGGFVGGAENGTITNSSVIIKNSVNGDTAGGFAGSIYQGKILSSSVVVNSVVGNGTYSIAGGFVGAEGRYGTVKNSSVVVNSVVGSDYAGGFAGSNGSIISNSSAIAYSVEGNKRDSNVGGFVGENEGRIIKSSNVVYSIFDNIEATSSDYPLEIGGFAGKNYDGTISGSSAIVNSISGSGSHSNIGGFVGHINRYSSDYTSQILDSSIIINSINSVNGNTSGGFIGLKNSGTISGSVSKLLTNNGTSGIGVGYYSYDYTGNYVNGSNATNITQKDQFFFNDASRDNDGLRYDGNLYITALSGSETEFNNSYFPFVFGVGNGTTNWGDTILAILSNSW